MLLGIVVAASVSFVTGVGILRFGKESTVEADDPKPVGPSTATASPQGA